MIEYRVLRDVPKCFEKLKDHTLSSVLPLMSPHSGTNKSCLATLNKYLVISQFGKPDENKQ